ncbi:hypothetical protein MJO28_009439 [Puccinia striiformis f. sp. tritici]|uniref:CxC1-like cysteine cluster associated with KDZ transposases domain-containing protein n=2 Tax=Puccinia striiformis TaxID=27350 RepID=A0A2S4UUZ8_9BASI|nr:hypothetical protein Pst134EA_017692 [Puccinia striiformis f. sp. tritici]KAI9614926.1 hypothetical protein KEM48_005838 [Puccinia striiformis f. sp. tritici PST-130]POW01107.1 hypothetical protein PSTT_12702 [Puccinia striiformis]KAH9451093.1 hypothetical protein Pst134EB_018591 [Puccinia striiformis f. sp. tritici]KAH9461386.1 hypothetical protein Pst134EA_017692 [Puccinia striiformis f. sp. tritici]KAI7947531.1 hypothetical protein MJO28_009439 [Puccinia striiformis f. sp. tritici]
MPRITQKLTVSRRSYGTVYRYGSSRSKPKLSPEEELRRERRWENFQRMLRGEETPEERLFDQQVKADEKRWQQANKARSVAELITVILPAYLLFQGKTNNWSSSKRFKDHSKEVDCRCDPSQLKPRSVQLVDIKSQKIEEIRFCACTSDNTRLLARGYIGASPRFPHTAFSLPLLKSHHQLLKHCELGNLPPSTQVWLETRSPLRNDSGKRPRYQRHFPTSIKIYEGLLKRTNDTSYSDTPKLTPQLALGLVSCPVCSSRHPQEDGDTVDQIHPFLMICPEGNIQHGCRFPKDKNYISLVTLSKSIKPKITNKPKTALIQT